ncbi:hypothetical protein [Rhodoferax sp.]|uniref:hypothetical protein n=1 Tax=Rhodoferax sp. TaxID=50421 RepID=UPI00374D2C2F
MRRTALPCLTLATLLAACSPALNWRTVRSEAHTLQLLLPCKPDTASRDVPMAGKAVALDMQGCDAGGATFAVSHVHLADATLANATLAGWKTATLANLHASQALERPFSIAGGWALPQTLRISTTGQRADGQPVSAQAVWFARIGPGGADLFNAVVYAEKIDPAVAETFFTGLKFD